MSRTPNVEQGTGWIIGSTPTASKTFLASITFPVMFCTALFLLGLCVGCCEVGAVSWSCSSAIGITGRVGGRVGGGQNQNPAYLCRQISRRVVE